MKQQEVVLVTPLDEPIGTMEKMEVHKRGLLHRAFSVFIFDSKGQMLLQQRAMQKYHGAHLWTNACCSHPSLNQNIKEAAERRLMEEMGFTTPLKEIFTFTYKATVENNLIEHELDHVFAGEYNGEVRINKDEASDYAYYSMQQLKLLLQEKPEMFTSWFKIAFPQIEAWWKEKFRV